MACALGALPSWAAPNGASVVAGQATVAASGKTLTITNTPGTIIQWQGFSIAPDELTRFIQQSASSSVLNRVVGQDPSLLLGRLQSNGRVFLINPNGITFGAGARIDVAGLVASTLDLGDADFLAGRLRFSAGAAAGPLTQLGTIVTQAGGQVLLVAPRIDNGGVIVAPGGEIVLAAGQTVQLADKANPDLRVTVEALPGHVVNVGELVAQGGRIGIHAGLIRQDGAVRADRAERGPGGEVLLRGATIALGKDSVTSASGSDGGRVTVDAGSGSVQASGRLLAIGDGGRGGSVRVLGDRIDLPAATVDASGAAGGGEILIGGDAHGANAAVANARTTTLGAGTQLRADASAAGDGGKVVVWADGATSFAGSIAARGGATSGDGGFVEVSGKETLAFGGKVDTTAARGRTGTLLLDPSDITISTGANASMSAGPTYNGTAATSNLNVTTLQTALATNNVVVDTTSAFASAGNISVNNAVTWASGNSLELRAHNNVTVGATINATGTGALRLIANQDGLGGGDVTVNAALTARSGGITLSGANIGGAAAGTLTATGLANQNAGAVSIAATGIVNLGGAIVASGGAAGAGSAGRSGGAVTISGTNVTTAAITASGSAGNGALQAGGNAGTVSVTGSGAVATGAITASTGAAGTTGTGGVAGNVALQGTTVTTGALTTTGGANGGGGSITATATAGLLNITGALIASGGTANASSAGSNAGNVTLSGVNVATASIAANGSAGATALSSRPGGAGGAVQISSTGGIATTTVAASGGAATTTDAAGGNAGSITLANSVAGNVTTTTLTAQTGAATGTGAAGSAGTVSLSNSAGNLQTGSITTSGGAKGNGGNVVLNASGAVTTGAAATITTSGGAAAGSMQGADAGDVTVTGSSVTMTLAAAGITANGGAALGLANARGGNAGAISLTSTAGAINLAAGNLNASGGNATAGVGSGGAAKNITLTSASDITTGAVTLRNGSSFGSGAAGGTAATLTAGGANLTLGAITTTGGSNGNGSAVNLQASGGLTTGAVTSSGGAGTANSAGGNAGALSLTATGAGVTTGAITASGGAGGAGAGAAGGNSASVAVTGSGTISTGAVLASGGNAGGTTAGGGNAGTVAITNASLLGGTLTTTTLTARTGAATGAALSGARGSIAVTNNAATLLQTGAINASGAAGGPGGDVALTSAGNVSVTSTISTSGGALNATTGAAGRNAGSLTIRGVNRNVTGAITASGGAALVAGNAGGDGGAIRLTGVDGTAATAGTLATVGITASSGAAVGNVASGSPGSIALEGTTIGATTLTTTGGANGSGGAISARASSGALALTGAVTASGGAVTAGSVGTNGGNIALTGSSVTTAAITSSGIASSGADLAGGNGGNVVVTGTGGNVAVAAVLVSGGAGTVGNAAGGNAGTITLDAAGATPTITVAGNLTARGGNRLGTAAAGDGGRIVLKDAVLLNTTPLTFEARGGSEGLAPGGDIHFQNTLDSTGSARALTLNTNAATIFEGAVGAASPLLSLVTNAAGTTQINGGSVRTTGLQSYADAVALSMNTTLDAGAGTITVSDKLDGPYRLLATTTGDVTLSGTLGGLTALEKLTVSGRSVTLNNVSVNGMPGSAIDILASQNICVNCGGAALSPILVSNGAPVNFVANPTATATGSRGIFVINAQIDSGNGDIAMTGFGGSNAGINNHGIELNNTTLTATGSGRITLTGTGRGIGGRGVSIFNPAPGAAITTVDGDITLTGTGAGTSAGANSADVTWLGYGEDRLKASGSGKVSLVGLGTSDFNGISIGTATVPLDLYGPALNQWNVSTASNLMVSGTGVAKTTGGDAIWTLGAPNSIEFLGSAGISSTQGKLNVVLAPLAGAVQLGSGSFSTNGGDFTIAGGANPASLVNPLLPATGATGTSAYPAGVTLNASTIDAGAGNISIIGTGLGGASQGYGILTSQNAATTLRTSGGGNITLRGFGGGATAGDFNTGVFLGTGLIETSGSGSIDIAGTASNTAAGAYNWGIRQYVFNQVQALGTGSIALWGRSGDSATGGYNPGVEAVGTIAGHGGPVTLTGIAGNGPGAKNVGIVVLGNLSNTGSGTLTLTGSGGSHAGTTSSQNAGIAMSDAIVSTVDGNLVLVGAGGTGGGSGNDGVALPLVGTTGYAGANSIVTTGAGNLVITGSPGPGGIGIVDAKAAMVKTTGTGSIFVNADSVDFGAVGGLTSAAGITLRPLTPATALSIGSAAAPSGGLALSDSMLGGFSWASGSALTLGSANTGATTVNTANIFANPLVVVSGTGADITLAAPLASTASGATPGIVLNAGRNFINNAGVGAIAATSAWRVYSTDPGADTRGGLPADFKQYDASFGSTPVLGSGNGTLYRVAPTLTVGLAGNVAKVYDGNAAATLSPANIGASGAIDGDTISVAAAVASFDSRDAGTAKVVTATGVSFGAVNGATAVYGYRLAGSVTSAAVGTITPAPLVVQADDRSRVQGQAGTAPSASFSGFVAGETAADLSGTLTFSTTALAGSPPGTYSITASGLSSSNYAIRYVDGLYEVLAAPLVAPVVPSPASFGGLLSQRDLRLATPDAGGPACVRNPIESLESTRWREKPYEVEPRCAPTGASRESR